MTTILVTGGAGFIGSHISEFLLDEGFNITIIDNFNTGKEINVPSNVKLIRGDITNPTDVKTALFDINIVCHTAAQASVSISMKKELFDAQINVLGTLELLKQCYAKEINHFLFTSTGGAIYGNPRSLPVFESHVEAPISIYGTSKLAAEKYIQFYQRRGLKTSILRLANVYGPRQDPSGEAGVISIFLKKILNNEPIQIFGDGTSSRDYIYVKDVAITINKLINNPISDPINVATGKQIFLNDLVNIISHVTEKSLKIIYASVRSGDVKNIYLDPKKLEEHIGWVPSTNITNGISKVWAWLKSRNS